MAQAGFGERLADAVRQRGTPALVGLDPRLDSLPEPLRPADSAGPEEKAAAYAAFCSAVIDVVAGLVPAVKPQAAFFEQLGPRGVGALAEVVRHARKRDLLVIMDAKRNDIGSTAEAYADAYLGIGDMRPLGSDALTISPYLGSDSMEPFVRTARQRVAGVFVLVKTSNPGGGQFQDLICDGRPLYRHVAEYVGQLAAEDAGASEYGSVGAVVGATYPEQLAELRAAMPQAWILAPGFGSQGATARDVAPAFAANGLGALVNNSRGIIFAHKSPRYKHLAPGDWQRAVEGALTDMIDQLRSETPAGKLAAG